MEGRLHNRRSNVKARRKTIRQSVLDERRQTGLLSPEITPEINHPRANLRTRGANRVADARAQATRLLEEKKAKRALVAKEVTKVKPPFNNYVRVKHTGLSPFRSYQDASKRSKVAPWRAPPPTAPLPSSSGSQTRATRQKNVVQVPQPAPAKKELPLPCAKVAPGVVLFGASRNATKSTFKPPTKIQPIPLSTGRNVPNKNQTNKSVAEKGKPKIVPKSKPVRNPSPKKNRLVKKPVPKEKQTIPTLVEPSVQPVRATRIATVKPRGMKPPPPKEGLPMKAKQSTKRVSRKAVEPSSRVLRSSRAPVPENKENLQPQIQVKARKSPEAPRSNPEPTQPTLNDVKLPEVDPPIDNRAKELEKRLAHLNEETERLKGIAEHWAVIKIDGSLPNHIVDEVDAVNGQTILLITNKFEQYKGLIKGAYTELRTTLEDLDGFWEMIYIQVRQLDDKYEKLAELKENRGPSSFPTRSVQTIRGRQSVRLGNSPLLNMSVDEAYTSPARSYMTARGSAVTPRLTPRALDNARRASSSIKYSTTIMRLSSVFQGSPAS